MNARDDDPDTDPIDSALLGLGTLGSAVWDKLAVDLAARKREERILAKFKDDVLEALNVMDIHMTPAEAYRIALAQGWLPHSANDGVWKSLVEGNKIQLWGYTGILGKTADVAKPAQLVGVQIGPMTVEPNVFSNDKSNLETAVEERINKKARARNIPNFVRTGAGKILHEMMGNQGMFSTNRVQEWLHSVVDMKDLMSGKWSQEGLAPWKRRPKSGSRRSTSWNAKSSLRTMKSGRRHDSS